MIDRRTIKKQNQEIDEELENLSDTEIMLEFSKLLTSIYPHLVKTKNYCYDPYDNISENLYFNFVHSTFSGKYGCDIEIQETHKYGLSLHCYRHLNHILITPKNFPFTCNNSQKQLTFKDKQELDNKVFVFIQFGDKQNYLSGDSNQVNVNTVNFEFVNFVIVDKKTGLNFRNQEDLWVDSNLVDFELVLEDFDKAEHQFYKMETYAD
ncbi:MAG: hypothetical protein RO257_07115 [Candidatus Kapabacteria bacterium]|nr:hypothetical protein [Candidatus Kapabacteria bacterium]